MFDSCTVRRVLGNNAAIAVPVAGLRHSLVVVGCSSEVRCECAVYHRYVARSQRAIEVCAGEKGDGCDTCRSHVCLKCVVHMCGSAAAASCFSLLHSGHHSKPARQPRRVRHTPTDSPSSHAVHAPNATLQLHVRSLVKLRVSTQVQSRAIIQWCVRTRVYSDHIFKEPLTHNSAQDSGAFLRGQACPPASLWLQV